MVGRNMIIVQQFCRNGKFP